MAAVWIAADLAGAVTLPEPAAMRRQVAEQLAFMDTARTATIAGAARSSRSRCTMWTRYSATSA